MNVICYINKLNDKKHIIISIDAEQAFEKVQHQFIIKKKNLLENHHRRKIPQHSKVHIQ